VECSSYRGTDYDHHYREWGANRNNEHGRAYITFILRLRSCATTWAIRAYGITNNFSL